MNFMKLIDWIQSTRKGVSKMWDTEKREYTVPVIQVHYAIEIDL